MKWFKLFFTLIIGMIMMSFSAPVTVAAVDNDVGFVLNPNYNLIQTNISVDVPVIASSLMIQANKIVIPMTCGIQSEATFVENIYFPLIDRENVYSERIQYVNSYNIYNYNKLLACQSYGKTRLILNKKGDGSVCYSSK